MRDWQRSQSRNTLSADQARVNIFFDAYLANSGVRMHEHMSCSERLTLEEIAQEAAIAAQLIPLHTGIVADKVNEYRLSDELRSSCSLPHLPEDSERQR